MCTCMHMPMEDRILRQILRSWDFSRFCATCGCWDWTCVLCKNSNGFCQQALSQPLTQAYLTQSFPL